MYIPKQKELLNLFDDLLDAILTDKTLKSKSQKDNTLMSSKDDNDNDNDKDNKNDNDETINDFSDKIIDKSKSFEEQIEPITKRENLDEYYFMDDNSNKGLKFKMFKLKRAHLSNIIDKKIFEQIFGHTFETLANKLINTTNKEENQIIVNNINKNKKNFAKKNFTKKMKWNLFVSL